MVGVEAESASGQRLRLEADWYLSALPVEAMVPLLSGPLLEAAPELGTLRKLRTEWMAGLQLYLDRSLPTTPGHAIYLDSPWALTSILQTQFWPAYEAASYGDGRVRSILSVCVSDWNRPGVLFGKPARQCTREEIQQEVWAQLRLHLPAELREELDGATVVSWFLDPAIRFSEECVSNAEPLLINTVGSWDWRPEAVTSIENLFLASDYVRTHTDLATMEGASEAARRAVNGLLERSQTAAAACAVWPLEEPGWLGPLRALDRVRYHRGLPPLVPPFERIVRSGASWTARLSKELSVQSERLATAAIDRGLDRRLERLEWRARTLWQALREELTGPEPEEVRAEHGTSPPLGAAAKRGPFPLEAAIARELDALERELRDPSWLPGTGAVKAAGEHVLQRRGKYLRARCVLTSAAMGRVTPAAHAHAIALAVELIHAATLLHDDVIDEGILRRGAPAARVLHGDKASILGGDVLMVRASELLIDLGRKDIHAGFTQAMDDILHAEALQLARARQALDESTYFAIIRGKTAALFRWACGSGASAAGLGEADIRALEVFGEHVGMAFQLMDDQLDVSGQADAMGKRPFADLLNGKWTYPALVVSRLLPAAGKLLEESLQDPAVLEDPSARSQVVAALSAPEVLAATRARAEEHIAQALEALQSAPPCPARDLLATLVFGAYYVTAYRERLVAFARVTVPGRLALAAFCILLVLLQQVKWTLLLAITVDIAGAIWTALELRRLIPTSSAAPDIAEERE